jgi:hypothetical protein
MKVAPAAAVIPILLLALSWLAFRAIDPEAERYDRALKALDRFTVMEIALQRDVLSARAGLLRNYDPLVRELNPLRDALGRLRDNAEEDAEEAAEVDRFAAAAARQEELTEQFKSDNALLQNSLAYFGLLGARLSTSDESSTLAPGVSALTAAMLQLTLDTSPAAAREVADRLKGLAMQSFPIDAAPSVRALVAHAGLLHDLLPATDGVLRALLAAPSQAELKTLGTMILARQARSRATAREFRVLLYAASLLLLGVLVHLGLRLRGRALTLRRRAAFEHLIAGISTRLIDAQPHEIGGQIDLALAEQARVLRSGGKACVATWGEPPGGGPFIAMSAALRSVFPGISPPPLPSGMLALSDADRLSAEMSAAGLGSVQVYRVEGIWRGALAMYISRKPRRCMVTCNPMRHSKRRIVSGSEQRSGRSLQSGALGRLSSFAPRTGRNWLSHLIFATADGLIDPWPN